MKNRTPRQPGAPDGGGKNPSSKSKTKERSDLKFRRVTIIYGKGMELCFEFPIQVTEDEMSHRIEEVLKLPNVSISTGEALYVIPTHAILTVVVKPSPKRLPPTVIRGARLLGRNDN
jgi:hypothetical protein